MQTIIGEIQGLTAILAGLRADNIVVDHLDQILTQLKNSDLTNQIRTI